jgi:hypothetical protein
MNDYYSGRSSHPAGLFSFCLLDGPQVRLRRPHVREAPAGFGLSRFATPFMNNPGLRLGVCPGRADTNTRPTGERPRLVSDRDHGS